MRREAAQLPARRHLNRLPQGCHVSIVTAPIRHHDALDWGMRTTLTLDDDIAAKLHSESRRSGRPFRDVVNEALRHGLAGRKTLAKGPAFRVETRDLGRLRPGLSLDSVADLLEEVEGPLHR